MSDFAQIEKLIAQFSETPLAKRCATKEGAAEMCHDVSVSFAALLHEHGIRSQLVTALDDMERTEHVVNLVGGLYIDWSAAQLEEGLEHPHLFDEPESYGFSCFLRVLKVVDYDPSWHRSFADS